MKKLLFLLIMGILILTGCSGGEAKTVKLTPEEARVKAENYINEQLMPDGQSVEVSLDEENTEVSGVYKVKVALANGSELSSYITTDGKYLFPESVDLDEKQEEPAETPPEPQANAPKSDKPKVELFVMSHCPYGTQIEKGMLPVVELLGDKIDYQLKFVDYLMHGEKEMKEEIAQYCIQKEQNNKFINYLKCFIYSADADSSGCLTQTGVNTSQLNSCIAQTDKEFKITEEFNKSQGGYPPFNIYKSENDQYGVQGSPTLVINQTQIQPAGRDSQSLLNAICSAFNNLPEECSQQLSTEMPSSGFGAGTASGSASGDCGS